MKLEFCNKNRWFFSINLDLFYKVITWNEDCYPPEHPEYEGDSIFYECKFVVISFYKYNKQWKFKSPFKMKHDGYCYKIWELGLFNLKWGEGGMWIYEDCDIWEYMKKLVIKQGIERTEGKE